MWDQGCVGQKEESHTSTLRLCAAQQPEKPRHHRFFRPFLSLCYSALLIRQELQNQQLRIRHDALHFIRRKLVVLPVSFARKTITGSSERGELINCNTLRYSRTQKSEKESHSVEPQCGCATKTTKP